MLAPPHGKACRRVSARAGWTGGRRLVVRFSGLRGQLADEDLDRVVNVLFTVRHRVLSPMTKARRAPIVARARTTDGNLL